MVRRDVGAEMSAVQMILNLGGFTPDETGEFLVARGDDAPAAPAMPPPFGRRRGARPSAQLPIQSLPGYDPRLQCRPLALDEVAFANANEATCASRLILIGSV